MLRTKRTIGSASIAVGSVVIAMSSAAPAHATPILTLDNNNGNGAWNQTTWYDRHLDRNFDGSDHVSTDQSGLSWSGQLGPQYFGDWGWSHDNHGKGRDPDSVPEPGTLSLFLTALLGGGLFLRARKAQGR